MAIALTSCQIRDQSSGHDTQSTVRQNYKLCNDSALFSSTFEEFGHDPQSSSTPLASVADHHLRTFSRNPTFFREAAAVSPPCDSTVSNELAHIMQGRVGSDTPGQHLPIAQESFGDYGSLGFNELSDFWGDLRLYSPEMASPHPVIPLQKLGWNEASTSCNFTGDPMSTTILPAEFHRLEQRRCSYPIQTSAETLAQEQTDLEYPGPLELRESNDLSWPVTSVGNFDSTLVYHGSSRSSTSEETEMVALSSKLRHQPEMLQNTLSPFLQSWTGHKYGFDAQSFAPRRRVQDTTGVEHFRDAVDDSKVTPGRRQHNFPQKSSRSSLQDLHRQHQPTGCGSGGKAHQFRSENLGTEKLKQKSKERSFAPRKYQRRRILDRNDAKHEFTSVPTPLDHVQRERQRRDLMTSKIAALELLLPKSAKRDRVSVVYDAIQLLKRLEREVQDLRKKFHETKLRRACFTSLEGQIQSLDPGKTSIPKSIDFNVRTSRNCLSTEVVIKGLGTYMKPIDILSQSCGTSGQFRPASGNSSMISSIQRLGDCKIREKENVIVEFHVHLDNDVTKVQQEQILKCRCPKDYLRTMMCLANEFQLDVTTCNIMKLSGYFICVVALKTRTRKETTAIQFAVRLQSAVHVDIDGEAMTIG